MSSVISPDQLAAKLRMMAAQAQAGIEGAPVANIHQQAGESNFNDLLANAIDKVNEVQQASSDVKQAFAQGDPNVSLADMMIAGQKAKLSFEAMVEVRNRLVSAYQEIMNMPV